jgi:aminoglycoside phosphotransferase (APT) family kinase protein
MDCVPRHFELGSWERLLAPCQAEFSAGTHQVLDEAALEGEHWMKALRQSPPSRFQTVALEALRDGVNVCRTHGDLARQNIRFSGDTPWIIDWEEMTEQGPCLTDKICFELCVWYYELGWPLDKVFNEFMSRYLCGPTRREAIHALAFLFALRGSMGELMVSFWNDHASEVATILRKGNLK